MNRTKTNMAILAGWGRFPVVRAPGTGAATRAAAEAALRAAAEATPSPALPAPGILPRGMGRSYGDASLPASGASFLDARGLDRFLAFDPATGVLEAEAGVTLHSLLQTFVPRGWFPPVTPGTRWVTLGGAVASNVHGKNHHHAGSIERFVEGLEVATPTGTFTCSPTERPDLFRATLGGYGLTGIVTRVRLRLRRVASPRVRVRSVRAATLAGLFDAFRAHDAAHEYSVAWVDTLARGRSLGRGILHLGDHADREAGDARTDARAGRNVAKDAGDGILFDVPFPAPSGLLQPFALRAFNTAYYRIPRPSTLHEADYAGFFYPLDRIGNWNRLYGPRGFHQYQFVIPDGAAGAAEAGVEECLHFLASQDMGSFLAVLKRCGDDRVMLPFCRSGYTLALDIPHRGDDTLRKLEQLDALVLRHGGRVYLTKDARLPRDTFRAMYPEWTQWMQTVRRYNPGGVVRSHLSERLDLWGE